jgi:RND family efflux transporter MFP subunit
MDSDERKGALVEQPAKRPNRSAAVRRIVLLAILAGAGVLIWRATHKREDYTGGDVQTTGTIEAVQVRLGFQVGGKIADVPVSEGMRVEAGSIVATLDASSLEVQVVMARAAIASAKADVAQARANRDKTALELSRARTLLQGGYATAEQMDTALTASRVAIARVEAAEAQVHQAESSLAQAQLQLSYAVLRTPQGGEVSERIHLPGEIVASGTPVVAIAQTDTVKVHAAVDETRVGAVRPGDRALVRVYTFDKRIFPGVVTDIEPAGEFATRKDWGAQRRDIRTFNVTARVPNPEHLLKDGMTADVTLVVSAPVRVEAER